MRCSVFTFPSFQKTLPMFPWRLSCVVSKAASFSQPQSQLRNLGEVTDLHQYFHNFLSYPCCMNTMSAQLFLPWKLKAGQCLPRSLPDEPSSVSDSQEAFQRCSEEGITRRNSGQGHGSWRRVLIVSFFAGKLKIQFLPFGTCILAQLSLPIPLCPAEVLTVSPSTLHS